jgi:hypothetical protein
MVKKSLPKGDGGQSREDRAKSGNDSVRRGESRGPQGSRSKIFGSNEEPTQGPAAAGCRRHLTSNNSKIISNTQDIVLLIILKHYQLEPILYLWLYNLNYTQVYSISKASFF